jgi:polysaccharide export outer membrane protein
LPLDSIIQDPRQNVPLQAGDVITALTQPLSFTVLGATGKNEELNFEVQGISLAQALARAGGLQDQRADARGLFIFRFEDPAALLTNTDAAGQPLATTPEGKVPVVYRVDLKDPAMFFVAQGFPIRNKDVLYVSNAPAAELQKFLNILSSIVFPIYNLRTLTN